MESVALNQLYSKADELRKQWNNVGESVFELVERINKMKMDMDGDEGFELLNKHKEDMDHIPRWDYKKCMWIVDWIHSSFLLYVCKKKCSFLLDVCMH